MPTEKEKKILGELQDFQGQLEVRPTGGLPVKPDIAAAERYQALVRFATDNFQFGVHYDVVPGEYYDKSLTKEQVMKDPSIKKCMNQPGAEMLAAAWGLHPEFRIIDKTETDSLFSYTVECSLRDQSGVIHGFAVGMASTNETKYRYRWMTSKQVQADPVLRKTINLDDCRTRGYGDGYVKYQVPNLEPGDLSPTLIMMAQKRAFVKATRTTFGISALFQQPLEDVQAALEAKHEREAEADKGSQSARPAPSDQSLPRAVASLKALFEERCKQHKLKGNSEKQARDKLFGAAKVPGWKSVLSDETEQAIEAWIDENLPAVETSGEEQGNLL